MTAPTDAIRDTCGTDAGYQQHHRRGEVACAACKRARAERTRRHRREHGYLYERAERKARAELARRFPAEYAELRDRFVTELRDAS